MRDPAPPPNLPTVLLWPDGRVATPAGIQDPTACWMIVGAIRQDGVAVSFVRVELAGATWATTVPSAVLGAAARGALVTLVRQPSPAHEPLSGWILFC